jgi:hypothetical protein
MDAALREQLNRIEQKLDKHEERHIQEARDTADYRQKTEGRLTSVERGLDFRSGLGVVGVVLAAVFQPIASGLTQKH